MALVTGKNRVVGCFFALGFALLFVAGTQAASSGRPELRISKDLQPAAVDPDTVLVRFRDGLSASARSAVAREAGGSLGAAIHGTAFTVVSGSAGELQARLGRDPGVAEVVPNFVRRAAEGPNDASFWDRQAPLDAIRLPLAWNTTHGSTATTIAILDTGVDLDHPDLAPRIVAGRDVVNGDDLADDDASHGTMVAGIAAATPGNGFGIAGAAWKASIMPVKVLGANGQGTDAQVATGITWAADHGASVINLSLGGTADSPALKQAVDYALSRNVLVVAAAGNAASSQPSYPAAYPGVVAVASTDDAGESSPFSNHGAWVDVAAPGEDLSSTMPAGLGLGNYGIGSGTSFASPLVAGIAALVRADNPTWTQAQVASRLYDTARDLGPRGIDDSYGHGLVDAAAALGAARQPALPPPGDSLEPSGTVDTAKPIGGGASATLSPEGDVDWFYADVAAPGTWLTYRVTPPDSSFDPVLQAYTPDRRLLTSGDRYGGAVAEELVVPAAVAGRYYLRVSNYQGTRTTTAWATIGAFATADYTVTVSQGSAPASRFAPYDVYRVGSLSPNGASLTTWPQWVAIGDLTGDGRNDVVLTTSFNDDVDNDNRIFLFPQLVDGSLGAPTRIDPGCSAPTAEIGDLNADGKADLAVACYAVGVKLYFQSGGQLGSPTVLTSAKASSLRIADVDRDGRNDLVVQGENGINVLRNGIGGWTTTLVSSVRGPIRAGDVTGDARPDVVVFDPAAVRVYVYAQKADGSFLAPVFSVAPSNGWQGAGLEVADLTHDGRLDVAVSIDANAPNAAVDVFPQTASGTLGTPSTYGVYDIPQPLAAGDVDADGRTDLVTLHGGWQAAGLLLQNASGALTAEELFGIPYATSYPNVAVGDVNGGGALDIVAPDYNHGLVVLRQYSMNLPLRQQLWVRGTSPADFAAGVATTVAPTVRFARALGAATVTPSTVALTDAESGAPVATAVSYDAASATATVHPTSPLASSKTYRVIVAGVKDAAGATMTETFGFRFTMGSTADVYPPETMIWNGSEGTMSSSSLGFSFASEERTATFTCSLNGAAFSACTSPAVYSVTPGTYTFQVRAKDPAGNVDATPARRRVVIVPVGRTPPDTFFATPTWPNGDVASTTATFSLASDATGATFDCSLDGAAYAACRSPVTYSGLTLGVHTFSARATSGGMVDPTPLTVAWTVVSGNPTAVVVSSLSARRVRAGVLVRWRTRSEIGLVAFEVFRELRGGRARLARVRALGGIRGRSYRFVDRRGPRGGARYWIRAVGSGGAGHWFGPAGVSSGLVYRG